MSEAKIYIRDRLVFHGFGLNFDFLIRFFLLNYIQVELFPDRCAAC